ncbi:MAG: 5-formyltetrahydrofolate cyclo-ligase [Candidatus Omnitrophica bacterium]|nr:5-formyltetrahydrofolate cyclo-ligase [Candidatus Omnitrophota bacterium]MDD5238667.1 5-formyltetrahydrofolate cyclo-ligase [Candidatus Omnitrophota bacterium]
MLTKEQIRSKILLRLKTQKEENRERKSKLIKKKLFGVSIFKKAKFVMFYIAFGKEVNTEEMIKEAKNLGKIVYVPVCKKNRITLRPCILEDNASLKKGPYGVCEPINKKSIPVKDLDLVIVPGIAFDKKGSRLGRGKGCYDRFLKKLPKDTPTIGLAFDFQIMPSLPRQTHDISVDKIIFA